MACLDFTYVEDGVVRDAVTEHNIAVVAVIYTERLVSVNPELLHK